MVHRKESLDIVSESNRARVSKSGARILQVTENVNETTIKSFKFTY